MLLVPATDIFSEPVFKYIDYKFLAGFTIPEESTDKEKAVSAYTGFKILFSHADLRSYVTLPKTNFSTINSCDNVKEKIDLLNDVRYGAGIFLFKDSFPVSLKIGQNTYSKSVSKIKNPSPSTTANPLTKSFSFSTGIGANLPVLTGSVQPFSYALSFSTKNNKNLTFITEGFFDENENGVISILTKYNFTKTIFIQSQFSLGRFYIENNSSYLKTNNALFEPDFFNSALAEFCFHSPFFKINFHSGLQESPYDVDSIWFKIDGRTSFKGLLLNFSYFAIPTTKDSPKPAPFIGGSSAICRIIEQASANSQLLFFIDDKFSSSIRIGFSALENWKVTATNTPVQLNTAKFRAALLYENKFFTTRFDWTHANILLAGTPPTKSSIPDNFYSYTLSSSYYGQLTKISLSAGYSLYPPKKKSYSEKEIYSGDLNLFFPKVNISAQTGINLTYKADRRYSGEIETGLQYVFIKKYFRSSIKASLVIPF